MSYKRVLNALAVSAAIISTNVLADWHSHAIKAMTTNIEWSYWLDSSSGENHAAIDAQLSAVFREVDEVMNRYAESSELSHVNRTAAEHPVVVSSPLFQVLNSSIEMSRLSDGAFDMTFASVGYLYDYREKRQPSQSVIDPAISLINYRLVILDKDNQTIYFRKPGVRLDLGGVAKGYSVDRAGEVLIGRGIKHARVSAGGDMRLLGSKRGEDWVIGIKDPRQPESLAVRLPLSNVAVSTSGDYERYFIDDDGDRVHHILSPSTGKPAAELQSVTVIGEEAIDTDALSTAVFVLGTQRGLALIDSLTGVDAILIDQNRNMHYSAGLTAPE